LSGIFVDVALAPPLIGKNWNEYVTVVIDVLRATSTIASLLDRGCSSVFAVRGIAEARLLAKKKGLLIGGERQCLPLKGFDYGNTPLDLDCLDLRGKGAVLTTTNGTRVIRKMAGSRAVLTGSFLNAAACCREALRLAGQLGCGIGIVCAGEKLRYMTDDACCAGLLVRNLSALQADVRLSDAARAAMAVSLSYRDPLAALRDSGSGRRLLALGRTGDLEYCAQVDLLQTVPCLVESDPCRFVSR
jgi:2-phosphosulfolactate phosphatase